MTLVFAAFLVLHGLIHALGFAKAFGFAEPPQLIEPISPFFGVLWLIDGVLFLAAAGALFLWPRWWWAIGACAIVVSMLIIVPSWTDAKFGALANLVALMATSNAARAYAAGCTRSGIRSPTAPASSNSPVNVTRC